MLWKFLLTAILTFISTEIDDFVVFVVLYSQAQESESKKSRLAIMLGQIVALIFVTFVCAFVAHYLLKIPQKILRFMGAIPILLGVKAFFDRKDEQVKVPQSATLFSTAVLLTLVSSSDNLGVYIPVFTTYTTIQKIITIILFAVFQIFWSIFQMNAAKIPIVSRILVKHGRWIIPVTFILLGLGIIFF